MADVTGTIGNEHVELNNAATEATLKLLLQATLAAAKGSTEEVKKIAALAGKAGLDSGSITRANTAVAQTTPAMNALRQSASTLGTAFGAIKGDLDVIGTLTKKIAAGNAQASDLFGAMKQLPGPLGLVAGGFAQIASYQEGLLTSYQDLTKSGANFGGSLTEMRSAAANTYMTLAEFSSVVKENSATFIKMGGSVNDGVKAFVNASTALNESSMADDLRALGYTSRDLNQGLADYISLTGGRTSAEMKNTKSLTEGATQYLEQLDGLSKLTGESREQLAAKMKEDAANQAWQAYLLTLDTETRNKANAAYTESMARGGKGAADALQAQLMGLPVQTEAGRKFVGTLQNANQSVNQLAAGVRDTSKSVDDVKKSGAALSSGLAKDGERLKQVGSAMIMAGRDVEVYGKAIGAANTATRNGIKSTEDQIAFEKKIAEEGKVQKTSQAADAAQSQKSMQELSRSVNELAATFMNAFFPIINSVVQTMVQYKGVVVAVVTALLALKAASAVKGTVSSAKELFGIGGGGGKGTPGAGGSSIGSTIGGAADGLSKVGPAMNSLGKGAGGMFAGIMKGIASGIKAFANPTVALGAVGFGVAIAAIGAGIAAAAWITGKALPTLAEGLSKIASIDGDGLSRNAKGMALLGASLLTFVPFGIAGIPAAIATGMLADNLLKLNSIDPAKLERTAAAMQKVKDASPSIGGAIASGISNLFGGSDTKSGKSSSDSGPITATNSGMENLLVEVQRLNNVSREMLNYIKETAEHTKQTVDATKALNGDLF